MVCVIEQHGVRSQHQGYFIQGSNEMLQSQFFSFSVSFFLRHDLPFCPQGGWPSLLGLRVSLFSSNGRKKWLLWWVSQRPAVEFGCILLNQLLCRGDETSWEFLGTVGKIDQVVNESWRGRYLHSVPRHYIEPLFSQALRHSLSHVNHKWPCKVGRTCLWIRKCSSPWDQFTQHHSVVEPGLDSVSCESSISFECIYLSPRFCSF